MRSWMLYAAFAATGWGQHPFTWSLVPAQSRQSDGALSAAMTAKYEIRPEGETWTIYRVHTNGTSETISQTLHLNGKEYPCGDRVWPEEPDTVVSRKLDERTAEVAYKKLGRITRQMVRTFSADGKQMTLEVRLSANTGTAAELWLVFARSFD